MYTGGNLANLSEEDKRRKKHSVEMEIIMLESDTRKAASRKAELEAEIKKIKYDQERLRISLEEKNKELEKTNFSLTEKEADIKKLKKELNLL